MNYAQCWLIIALLLGVGVILPFVFLQWGEGAFDSLGGDRITILVVRHENTDSFFGAGYGLYTLKGIPDILLGLIAPICLFAGAAFVALGTKAK